MAQLRASPAANADDGQYATDLSVFSNTGQLSMGPANGNMFLRFPGLAIPPGSTITAAVVTLTFDGELGGITGGVVIQACDEDNSAQAASAADIDNRASTDASVPWDPGDSSDNLPVSTPDLKDIVQEVVDRAGWKAGNALQLVLVQNDMSNDVGFDSFDHGSGYAVLVITYTLPAGFVAAALPHRAQVGVSIGL